jgi:CBS domain-containing protein
MDLQTLITENSLTLVSCVPSNFIDEAIEIMVKGKKNAVAVVDTDGMLAGILTDHDIMRAIYGQQDNAGTVYSEHVSKWMTATVVTAPPETSMAKSLDLMGKHHIRHLVVAENGKPVAIVSIRDILRKLHEEKALENSILRDIAIAARASIAA